MSNDIVYDEIDKTYLTWDDRSRSSDGTTGCFLKTYEIIEEEKIYYKLSNYDSYRGVFGHESVNELIVSRLCDILNINHVQYKLINAKINVNDKVFNSWICSSKNFICNGEQKISLGNYYDIMKITGESPEAFCKRNGFEKYIDEILLIDFLVLNRDRHDANIEVLIDKNKKVRLAPIYDNGLSLIFSCNSDLQCIEKFDISEDGPVNNYLYTKSTKENLQYISKDFNVNTLMLSDKNYVIGGIDKVLTKTHAEKIWEMIWNRWQYYDRVRYQKT